MASVRQPKGPWPRLWVCWRPECDRLFWAKNATARYCSRACVKAYQREFQSNKNRI